MEQQIRFCTSSDGVRIAYATVGQGRPFLNVPGWGSNLELLWQEPEVRRFLETLAEGRLLVWFDRRGLSSSQRDVTDLSLDAQVADVAAITDHLRLEQLDIGGYLDGAAVSIAYAAKHPERISRLVLWSPFAFGGEIFTQEATRSLVELIRANWGLGRRAIADIAFPTGPTEFHRWYSNMLRQSVTPEIAAKYVEFHNGVDVRDYLPQVKASTIVLHGRDDRNIPLSAGKAVAAMIPETRFVALDGPGSPLRGNISNVEIAIEFLDEGRETTAPPRRKVDYHGAEEDRFAEMIGGTISHYKILEKLGEGGMGVVYKAEDTILHRPVALKFLSQDLIREYETRERFLREARAAAALDHPNICTVYEIAETKGQTFIAMAHIEGQGLDEKLKSGPLDVNEAIDLAIQIAEGLQEAHEKEIIHRDIKTANIMVTKKGHARIMDFGLAKLAGLTRLTKTATIMGTVAYMSPEQAHGEAAIDHHTDIWSMGILLYEMLAGRLPFDAPSDAGLIHKIIYEEPEPLSSLGRKIPAALEQAIKKMMQKDPRDRYEDMGALIADLKSIQSGAAPEIMVKEKYVPSIVVLPFVDMSPQKDQEYFCDGISESLINALTQLSHLRVIARTSAFSFKGQKLDVREIGKKLGVEIVLEGSVQKAGNSVRITTQLVNAISGQHLWSEKYDRELKDIFAIQDEITLAIVDELKPKLRAGEKEKLAKRQAVDLEAYNLYLKGRWFWNRATKEGFRKAIGYFEQAIEKAPDYAQAYAGLADSYISLPYYSSIPSREAFPKAREAVLKALEIDDMLAEAHATLAFIKMMYDWAWKDAEKEYIRAIELNPGYSVARLWYAYHLTYRFRFEEAIKEVKQALELDPLSLIINAHVGVIFFNARRYDEAIGAFEKMIEMDPNYLGAHTYLGLAYLNKSMYEKALAEFEREKELSSTWNPLVETGIGIAHTLMGRTDEAREMLNTIVEKSKRAYVLPVPIAMFCFTLGEYDQGFKWLEQAYKEHDHWLCPLMINPLFDPVRSDPRFVALLKKMGLDK